MKYVCNQCNEHCHSITVSPCTLEAGSHTAKPDICPFFDRECDAHCDVGGMMTDFITEYELAHEAYPPITWAKMHRQEMHRALEREVNELKTALWADDLNGDHGIIKEALHCQVVAQRIIDECSRREAVKEGM